MSSLNIAARSLLDQPNLCLLQPEPSPEIASEAFQALNRQQNRDSYGEQNRQQIHTQPHFDSASVGEIDSTLSNDVSDRPALAVQIKHLSPVQHSVMMWLLTRAPKGGRPGTYDTSHRWVAQGVGKGVGTVKNAILRVIAKGLLSRVRHVSGRNGWTRYAIAPPVAAALLGAPEPETKSIAPATVSSLFINLNNQQQTVTTQIERTVGKLGLEQFRISANDVMSVWRQDVFKRIEDLLCSLEHLAFYLRSEDAQGITKPKAWLMAQLKHGYYAPPVGFEAWDEQQERIIAEVAEAKLARMQKYRERAAEANAQLAVEEQTAWLKGLSQADRQRLLARTPISNVYSEAAEAILRSFYTQDQAA